MAGSGRHCEDSGAGEVDDESRDGGGAVVRVRASCLLSGREGAQDLLDEVGEGGAGGADGEECDGHWRVGSTASRVEYPLMPPRCPTSRSVPASPETIMVPSP